MLIRSYMAYQDIIKNTFNFYLSSRRSCNALPLTYIHLSLFSFPISSTSVTSHLLHTLVPTTIQKVLFPKYHFSPSNLSPSNFQSIFHLYQTNTSRPFLHHPNPKKPIYKNPPPTIEYSDPIFISSPWPR